MNCRSECALHTRKRRHRRCQWPWPFTIAARDASDQRRCVAVLWEVERRRAKASSLSCCACCARSRGRDANANWDQHALHGLQRDDKPTHRYAPKVSLLIVYDSGSNRGTTRQGSSRPILLLSPAACPRARALARFQRPSWTARPVRRRSLTRQPSLLG